MFTPDKYGRVFFDDDFFVAPFGHYQKDFDFVDAFYGDPDNAKNLYADGYGKREALYTLGNMIKNGAGWIGFYKNERVGYLALERVVYTPLVIAVHGGIDRSLWGSGYPQQAMAFLKHMAFDKYNAVKMEGYTYRKRNLLAGLYKSGGLTKECEIKDRISIDGELKPFIIYSLSKQDYEGE